MESKRGWSLRGGGVVRKLAYRGKTHFFRDWMILFLGRLLPGM